MMKIIAIIIIMKMIIDGGNKQEGHDGPEVAHLYKGTRSRASLNPRDFI
jgi:hypothetical protein